MVLFLTTSKPGEVRAVNFANVELALFQEKRTGQPDRLTIRFTSGRIEWFPMPKDDAENILDTWVKWAEG